MEAIILPYKGKEPKIAKDVFVAPSSSIVGDVSIGAGSSIWFGATVRGDFQPVRIGNYTNIQDNCTVHVMGDTPTEIGNYVTPQNRRRLLDWHGFDNSRLLGDWQQLHYRRGHRHYAVQKNSE